MVEKKNKNKFVIIKIEEQLFGILVDSVIDILLPQTIYPIPLVGKHIRGSMNLRGRVVTTLDLKVFFGMEKFSKLDKGRCIVIENSGELYSFLVDEVGNVCDFKVENLVKTPDTLSQKWQDVALGLISIKEELVIILDINKVIESIVK